MIGGIFIGLGLGGIVSYFYLTNFNYLIKKSSANKLLSKFENYLKDVE